LKVGSKEFSKSGKRLIKVSGIILNAELLSFLTKSLLTIILYLSGKREGSRALGGES
jgi:hypothetical protein